MTDPLRIVSGKSRSALIWAERAHRGQQRDEDVPYILHPFAVAQLLAAAGADRNLVCAGCLHDVLEDTDVTADELEQEFGANVLRLVLAVTKDRSFKGLPLEQQAELVTAKCRKAGVDACALKAADLTANMTDLVHGAEEDGVGHWERVFGADRYDRKLDHYMELATLLRQEIASDYPGLAAALEARANEMRILRDGFVRFPQN